jgi:hypothetical protein
MGGMNRDRSEGVRLRKPLPTLETLMSAGISDQSKAYSLAAGAAGTTGSLVLPFRPIANANGNYIGKFGDSSLSFSGTALTTEVSYAQLVNRKGLALPNQPLDINNFENEKDLKAYLENGEYYVIYETGDVYYKKADATVAVTATFKIQSPTSGAPGSATAPSLTPNTLRKTIAAAGTAEALAASATPVSKAEVQADFDNTQSVFIGDSTVDSSNGIELIPGAAITLENVDLANMYADVDVNGEAVNILYYTP